MCGVLAFSLTAVGLVWSGPSQLGEGSFVGAQHRRTQEATTSRPSVDADPPPTLSWGRPLLLAGISHSFSKKNEVSTTCHGPGPVQSPVQLPERSRRALPESETWSSPTF